MTLSWRAVAIGCAALDVLIFQLLAARGALIGHAHLGSFAVAGVIGLALLRGTARERVFVACAGIAALLLRGGVLATCVTSFGWPAAVGIFPAVAVAFLVIAAACRLLDLPAAPTRWRTIALAVAGYLALLRLAYMGPVELLPEEAYYWNYAKHLDIGYLDHPPLVAWMIAAGTAVFGDTEIGVRITASLCWFATAFFVFRLARNLFDETTAWCSILLLSALPFFFGTAAVITPDSPLTTCWAGSLHFLERALLGGRRNAWLGLGVTMGLGMLSKYSIGLVGIGAAVFMIIDADARRWFLRWEPYAATLLAFLIFSPALIWNWQHDWISFTYQSSRRISADPQFSLHELIGSVAAVLTPIGLVAGVAAFFVRNLPDEPLRRQMLFAKIFTLTPMAVFVFFSLRHEVKLSWTGPVWLALLPLLALGMTRIRDKPVDRWIRAAWLPTVGVCVAAFGLCLHYLALGLPGAGYGEEMNLLPVGWRELARQVDEIEDAVTADTQIDPLVVGADRNFIASELAFYDDDQPEGSRETAGIHLFDRKALMYELWFPPAAQTGKTVVLVGFNERDLTRKAVQKHATEVGPVLKGELKRDGEFIRSFYYRIATGYRAADEEKKRGQD